MKKFYIVLMLLFTGMTVHAQIRDTTYWYRYFELGITFSQSGFNDAWKGGGTAATAFSGILNVKSEWNKNKQNLVNDLQLQYGRSNISGIGTRKTIDRIFFDNVYNYAAFKTDKWSIFASATFQSQFDVGNRYDLTYTNAAYGTVGSDSVVRISNFLAPGYLTEAAGLQWKPVSYFSARFSPLALKQLFNVDAVVKNNGNLYGMDATTMSVKNEFGINVVAKFDKDLHKNINVKLIYQYYSRYSSLAVSTNRLDFIATAKVTKYITANALATFLYDQTQSTKIQISSLIGIGLAYKLASPGTP